MQVPQPLTPLAVLLRIVTVLLIAVPIVAGVAVVSLALAYQSNSQLALGIVLLAGGLLVQVVRDVLR